MHLVHELYSREDTGYSITNYNVKIIRAPHISQKKYLPTYYVLLGYEGERECEELNGPPQISKKMNDIIRTCHLIDISSGLCDIIFVTLFTLTKSNYSFNTFFHHKIS